MKTRHGFVSNSSSSSFLLVFPRIPSSEDDVHSIMFPKGETTVDAYDQPMSSRSVAARVYDDIQGIKESLKPAEILEEISSGWFPGQPDHDYSHNSFEGSEQWDERYELEGIRVAAAAEKARDNFMKHIKPTDFVFCVSYADEDGESTLEHGEIFGNVHNMRISHH